MNGGNSGASKTGWKIEMRRHNLIRVYYKTLVRVKGTDIETCWQW